jgi:hypothetical protein
MLHARLEVAQILDRFEVRVAITEFAPGTDPVFWSSAPLILEMPEDADLEDVLSTVLTLIRLWSESTNHN